MAPGYEAAPATVPADGDLEVKLRNARIDGTVRDEAGAPIAGVRVFVDGVDAYVETDVAGKYQLDGVPESGSVVYKMPGYRLGVIPISGPGTQDVTLPHFEVRALYAPGAVFEGSGRLDAMLSLLEQTEANAMVIDVKEAGGYLYYQTDLGPAVDAGAVLDNPIFVLEELLPALKARGIYTIARMVSMKDNTLAGVHPELAVQNSATGQPWTDYGGNVWLDPSSPGVAEYLAAIAGDLAAKGFDEVQLDYIRFFSDGPYDQAVTRVPNTQSFRLPAIRRVLRTISDTLDTTKTFLGADVFPISFIASDDQGIGQRPEVIMPFVDYFSPMVYPSHYGSGVFNIAVPNEHPYEMIDQTLEIMNRQSARPAHEDPPLDPGFRLWFVPEIHRGRYPCRDVGAGRQPHGGLDDLECVGPLHRGSPGATPARRVLGLGHLGRPLGLMRVVIQRVTRAEVRSDGSVLGRIDRGAMVLAGIAEGDTATRVTRMADKVAGLRLFADQGGHTNLDVADVGGSVLVVSQFTLLADVRRGRRPSFGGAAQPAEAAPLIDLFCDRLRTHGLHVETGRFGATMEVELVNDGPFTVLLDSERDLGPV